MSDCGQVKVNSGQYKQCLFLERGQGLELNGKGIEYVREKWMQPANEMGFSFDL